MCGIAAFIGRKSAQPILYGMLCSLKYRGYDSAGVKIIGEPTVKAAGDPEENLVHKLPDDSAGTAGIAHNRWATHGEPNATNAHPHSGYSGKLSIVHNGTIENFRELRNKLVAQGVTFVSETDTEVFAHLIDSHYDGDLYAALEAARAEIRGTYGVVVLHEDHPNELIVACMGSPIVIGIAEDGHYVASDEAALVSYTRRVFPLEDGESAKISNNEFTVFKEDGEQVNRDVQMAEGDVTSIQRGGYKHFMRKEIGEAPQVIKDTTRGRLMPAEGMTKLGGIELVEDELLARTGGLMLIGCGSAHYASQVGAWMLREYANVDAQCVLGSEFRHQRIFSPENKTLIAVSQSGGTLDTRMSVKHGKDNGMLTLGIVNAVGSQIARETDAGIYNQAGPEIAVASTKAVLSQITAFAMLTIFLGRKNGTMSQAEGIQVIEALQTLPDQLVTVLNQSDQIERIAAKYGHHQAMMFIGQDSHAPIAHEGALKLREVALRDTLGVAAGELKHGSIALLHENYPVVALAPQGNDAIYDLVMTNLEQVSARKSPIIAIATEGDEKIGTVAKDVIYTPKTPPLLQPILSVTPIMLMSYYIGVNAGVNVDQPPNLAKSVTVA